MTLLIKKISIIILLLIPWCCFLFSSLVDQEIIKDSPQQNAIVFFVKQYVSTGSFKYYLDDNTKNFEDYYFAPRDMTVFENALVPQNSLGSFFIYSYAFSVLNNVVIFGLLTFFAFVICGFQMYKFIIHDIGLNKSVGFITLSLFYIFPPLLLFSYDLIRPEFLSTLLVFISILLIYRIDCIGTLRSNLVPILLLFGSSILIRYDNVLIIIFLGLFLLIRVIQQRKKSIKDLFLILITFIVIISFYLLLLLLLNNDLYGNPFKLGYQIAQSIRDTTVFSNQTVQSTKLINLNFHSDIAFSQLIIHFVSNNTFLTVTTLLGTFIIFKRSKYKRFRLLTVIFTIPFLAIVYMNASRRSYGFDIYIGTSSFFRYILIFFPLHFLLFSIGFSKISKKVLKYILAFLMVFSFMRFNTSVFGISSIENTNGYSIRSNVLKHTKNKYPIIVAKVDKYIFEERLVIVASQITKPDAYIKTGESYFDYYPTYKLLASRVEEFVNYYDGVYMTEISNIDPEMKAIKLISDKGYKINICDLDNDIILISKDNIKCVY